MEPTNKTADVFMRAMRMMDARGQGTGGYAILTAMFIAATRQMYLREVEGQTREAFEKEIVELSWELEPFVNLPG